jgi:hypothetical protein
MVPISDAFAATVFLRSGDTVQSLQNEPALAQCRAV